VDRWREVEPPPPINGDLEQVLQSVDALRAAWEDALATATLREFSEARRRSLRRHAIETGIIERLYDIDWGVTEAVSIQVLDTRKILFCRGAGWGCDRLVGCRVPTSSPARS